MPDLARTTAVLRRTAPSRLWRDVMAIDRGEPVSVRMLLIAALGMGAPVVVGLMLKHAEAGFTIGLGAILLAGTGGSTAAPPPPLSQTVAPALIAVAAATAIAGLPQPDIALVLLAAVAALLSGSTLR